MPSSTRLTHAVSFTIVRAVVFAVLLAGSARIAFADPPPPFIVQFPASLASPSGIASDAAGNVYIADTGNNRVLKYSNIGALLTSWGTPGSANGQFNQPWGIAVDASNVYVGDSGNNRVQKFTQAGAFVAVWTVAGAHGVALDGLGNLFVAGTSAIGKYTLAGGFVTAWGSAGAGNGQFNAPFGVAADAAGNVYVADTNNGRVQKFTSAGTYVAQWGGLTTPDGVCVDNGGHVIVVETGGYRVDAFTGTGVLISQWGSQGAAAGQFQLARAVTTNANGNVYVLDSGNQRLEVFGTVTSVTMAADVNPTAFGQPVTLTAIVAPTTVAGVVYFKDGAAVIGPAGPSGLTVSNFSVGSHALTAFYGGDPNSAASTSPMVTLVVHTAATATALVAVLNPSGTGQPVTFTTTVTAVPPGAGVPTGNVTLAIDGVPASPVALAGGVRTTVLSSLAPGTRALTVAYAGDTNFAPSTSTVLAQVVLPLQAPPSYLAQWPGNGAGGNSRGATNLASDAAGELFVPDYVNSHVQVFTGSGVNIIQFGTNGSNPGQMVRPAGAATDASGYLYITDAYNNRVTTYDLRGAYQAQWGTAGSGDGQFSNPNGIVVDGSRNIFVADEVANRIQKFASWGGFLAKWGSTGTGNGQFSSPTSLAADRAGNIYVADAGNFRIQKFTGDGVYLGQWGSEGSLNGQFEYPGSIVMDAADNLLVVDTYNHRVEKFTANGAFLGSWGAYGTLPGQFLYPQSITVDPTGDVFVMDQGTYRIQKFFFLQSLATITDVPADQGHQVRIRFLPNGADNPLSPTPVTGYEIYRRVSTAPGLPARGVTAAAAAAKPATTLIDGWDYLLSLPAHNDAVYETVVPTLSDSDATGLHRSVFLVRAATSRPSVYWDSAPDSGYSVDNLPPAVPAPFTAAYASGATALHWGRNTEPDLGYYRIYRGAVAGFTPSPATLLATRSDTGYVDPGPSGGWYALAAVDIDGNSSGFARLGPGSTAAVGGAGPLAFALSGTRPNPARGNRLSVEFVLAVAQPARLDLLDVTGRLVATRDAGVLGIGRHTLDLAAGHAIAPGIYLVRLTQGRERRTVRAVVLE